MTRLIVPYMSIYCTFSHIERVRQKRSLFDRERDGQLEGQK